MKKLRSEEVGSGLARNSILRSQATRTAEWRQPYVASDDPDARAIWWLNPADLAEAQLRRTAEGLPPLEPVTIEDEPDDYNPRFPMEDTPDWVATLALMSIAGAILIIVAGVSILCAIEIWRAPWSDIFLWLEDHRAASIGIYTVALLVLFGVATLAKHWDE